MMYVAPSPSCSAVGPSIVSHDQEDACKLGHDRRLLQLQQTAIVCRLALLSAGCASHTTVGHTAGSLTSRLLAGAKLARPGLGTPLTGSILVMYCTADSTSAVCCLTANCSRNVGMRSHKHGLPTASWQEHRRSQALGLLQVNVLPSLALSQAGHGQRQTCLQCMQPGPDNRFAGAALTSGSYMVGYCSCNGSVCQQLQDQAACLHRVQHGRWSKKCRTHLHARAEEVAQVLLILRIRAAVDVDH